MFSLAVFIVSVVAAAGAASLPQMSNGSKCEKSRVAFNLPHPDQCDGYFRCENELLSEKLCEDGLAFDLAEERCMLLHQVDCTGRNKIQPPQGTGNCTRMNGLFPRTGTCDEYYYCRDDIPLPIKCPTGLIYDPEGGVCEFPDVALRPGCLPEEVLHFRCPALPKNDSLAFGDHLRFAKDDDCRYFFKCLRNGHPRLGGCEWGLVYNKETGFCDKPENVTGCQKYYDD